MVYVTDWNSGQPETRCGRGSKLEHTELIRALLPALVTHYDVRSIADVGCGDQNWIKHVQWPRPVEYRGFDLKHCGPRFDVVEQVLPRAFDMVMTIFVLNHLHVPGHKERAIRNLRASGSRLLLSTFWEWDDQPALPGLGEPLEKHFLKMRSVPIHYGVFEL